jgi:TRAP-type C4-dicarboxylate transport system permease small subunit
MGYGSVVAGVGIVLIAVGLILGYFSGVHIEHTVTTVNILSEIGSYLWTIIIAAVIVAIGGLMVIFGIKKS